MKISVNMLVKNEEMFLPYALRSIFQIADEIIIVDNMSTDKTPQILENFYNESRIYSDKLRRVVIEKIDSRDIAEMRNWAKERSNGEFVLVCDGDEVFYTNGPDSLFDAFTAIEDMYETDQPNLKFVQFPFYHFYGDPQYLLADDPSPVIRVFKNDPDIRWAYPNDKLMVHEFPQYFGKEQPTTARVKHHFAHFGYCKPNYQLWRKGRDYQDRGHENSLWHRPANECLNGTAVKLFQNSYPSVMSGFPFYRYKIETEARDEKLVIKHKGW